MNLEQGFQVTQILESHKLGQVNGKVNRLSFKYEKTDNDPLALFRMVV